MKHQKGIGQCGINERFLNHHSMSTPLHRAIIYPKDVELITGKSRRSAQRLMRDMREFFQKGANGLITFLDFCNYTQVSEKMVMEYLRR
jgi:hypothetical protein